MARYPGATWRPLPENETEPNISPTQLILHSAVSRGQTLWHYFGRKSVVVESHFYVQDDGDAEQYIDTSKQADANYRANVRAISVETWDDGDPDRVPWTSAQLLRLADIALWAHREHGVPLVRAPRWDAPGIGGHTDFPGIWTPVAKTCPGVARRPQINTVIEMAKQMLAGGQAIAPVPGPLPAPATPPAPPFPLPRGWYFGPKSGPRHSVSGYYSYRSQLKLWQSRMKARGWSISADGLYGPETERVAKNFQREKGLGFDGLIGPETWSAAWTTPVT